MVYITAVKLFGLKSGFIFSLVYQLVRSGHAQYACAYSQVLTADWRDTGLYQRSITEKTEEKGEIEKWSLWWVLTGSE